MPETVRFFKQGAYARIKPDYLGGAERFQEFLRAIEGARYDRAQKANLAPLDKVPAILVRLREAGFDARYEDKEIHDSLLERTAQQWLDLKSAQERIERIDDELFERTGNRLFTFQKTGAQWLIMKFGALLADDPGTGKTLQTIAAIPPNAPVLVVCPSAAKGVWIGEVERWRPQIRARMLSGRDSFRWPLPGELLVTNYDILPDVHKDGCDGFLPPPPPKPCAGCQDETIFRNGLALTVKMGHEPSCTGFEKSDAPKERCPGCHPFLEGVPHGMVLVSDESQALKNGKANRTLRFRSISKAVREKEGRVWLLSGTPMENDPIELWSVLQAADLAAEAFGSFKNFLRLFKGQPKTYGRGQKAGYDWGEPDEEVTERLQRVQLRRKKEDVLPELPDLIWGDHVVEIDKKSFASCDAFVARYGGLEEVMKMVSSPKMSFETFSKLGTILAVAKLSAAMEIVKEHEERGEPLLVFSMHREPIDILAKRKGWLAITGDVSTTPTKEAPSGRRHQIQEMFQKGHYKGVACMIQAAGVALTLTRASHELFIDMSFNPMQNQQAAARAHRIGAKATVYAKRLRSNHPLDRRLQELITKKMAMFASSVDRASVTDDAPPCANIDFEDQIRQVQEEISLGRSVRRMAESPEEEKALEDLHSLVFSRASSERIAQQLGQEALSIGISEKQWELARKIALEGVPRKLRPVTTPTPGEEKKIGRAESDKSAESEGFAADALARDESRVSSGGRGAIRNARGAAQGVTEAADREMPSLGKDGLVSVGSDPHLPECALVRSEDEACDCGSTTGKGALDMAKVTEQFERIRGLTDGQRLVLFTLLAGGYDPEDVTKATKEYKTAAAFSENEEDALLKLVTKAFCTDCGQAKAKTGEHECPADEEDEDDSEDEEEEEDES